MSNSLSDYQNRLAVLGYETQITQVASSNQKLRLRVKLKGQSAFTKIMLKTMKEHEQLILTVFNHLFCRR